MLTGAPASWSWSARVGAPSGCRCLSTSRSEEHTSELQSHSDLHSFPTRRSSDLEVASLGLEDVDWRAGELVVVGKGRRAERLPLPVDVGEALTAYLADGRPPTAQDRCLFVRVKAPHRGLTTGGITQ